MNQTFAATLVLPDLKTGKFVSSLAILGFVAGMALAAKVAVFLPFSPVPLTLQVAVVLLAGLVLDPKSAFMAQAAYVGFGAIGMPWFAAVGPFTIGYLAGFMLAAPLVSVLSRRLNAIAAVSAGVATILLAGAAYLVMVIGFSVADAFLVGVLPFVPGDMLKASLALVAGRRMISHGSR